MTRVLLVSQYYWPESFTITAEVARLASQGFQITVLTGQPNYPAGKVFLGYSALSIRRDWVEGTEVIRLPLLPRGSGSGLRLMLNYLSFILSGFLIAPFLLRGRKFDTILVFGLSPLLQALPAVLLSRLKRAPLVIWVQDLWPESLAATGFVRNPIILGIVRRLVQIIYKNANKILVQSDAFRGPVANLSPVGSQIHCVPNSGQTVPPGAVPSAEANALAQRLASGFSLVFAGNLGYAQAMDTVLDAAEQLRDLPDFTLYLVGSGALDNWLSKECRRRNLTMVECSGRYPPADMPAILSQASALLVSLRKEAIFSLTVPSKMQTYLSVGRPIIASLDGEGARILDEAGAGFAAPANDATALASAIRSMASLPESERTAMGQSGKRYFDLNFAPDRITKLLSDHLSETKSAAARQQGE